MASKNFATGSYISLLTGDNSYTEESLTLFISKNFIDLLKSLGHKTPTILNQHKYSDNSFIIEEDLDYTLYKLTFSVNSSIVPIRGTINGITVTALEFLSGKLILANTTVNWSVSISDDSYLIDSVEIDGISTTATSGSFVMTKDIKVAIHISSVSTKPIVVFKFSNPVVKYIMINQSSGSITYIERDDNPLSVTKEFNEGNYNWDFVVLPGYLKTSPITNIDLKNNTTTTIEGSYTLIKPWYVANNNCNPANYPNCTCIVANITDNYKWEITELNFTPNTYPYTVPSNGADANFISGIKGTLLISDSIDTTISNKKYIGNKVNFSNNTVVAPDSGLGNNANVDIGSHLQWKQGRDVIEGFIAIKYRVKSEDHNSLLSQTITINTTPDDDLTGPNN